MPETKTVDEVVSDHKPATRSLSARPSHDESVGPDGKAHANKGGVEDENHGASPRLGRTLPASTEALLAKMEKSNAEKPALAPHEEGDPDEDEPADDAGDADGEAGDEAGEGDGEPGDGEADGAAAEGDGAEGEGDEPEADPIAPLKEQAARLEARNRELVTELENAKKTPKAQRTERETALVAAEAAYIEEGSVPALRKFLAVVIGAAPDSKEVDAELSGLYTDLTARELGVALDDNQRNLRDNARTRLLLARDKREKVEAEKKPVADNSADDVRYEEAAKHVTGMLTTKTQGGTSLADEYPLLMTLAKDFDGYEPGEVLARAIRQDALAGTLDPKLSDLDMIRAVAPKIEKHYDAVAKRIEAARAKTKKPDTTTPSVKPKAAVEASNAKRQSTGAPTITTTAASRAPAKNPKVNEKPQKKTMTEKTRKDFPSEAAWKDYLFAKHFKS